MLLLLSLQSLLTWHQGRCIGMPVSPLSIVHLLYDLPLKVNGNVHPQFTVKTGQLGGVGMTGFSQRRMPSKFTSL